MKGSVDISTLTASEFQDYGRLCAVVLARAHSQSPGGAVIRGYLKRSDQFDLAIADGAVRYADQAAQDLRHTASGSAACQTSGRIRRLTLVHQPVPRRNTSARLAHLARPCRSSVEAISGMRLPTLR
jgi:Uncharacterized protein conserved in bacteria (DUF2252)